MKQPGFACRGCHGADVGPVLSLGRTPLANSFIPSDGGAEPEATYPLDLVLCRTCALLQITETVPREELFDDYLYFSSFSDTMLAHCADLAARLTEARALGPRDLVMDVASNDGYLLQFYRNRGIRVLGVDPARNVVEVAQRRGVETVCAYFGVSIARQIVQDQGHPAVVHANNVLAHVAGLDDFLGGFAVLLEGGGEAVIEVPYARDMIDRVEFDTIYHEHLSYFTLTALCQLFERNGLVIHDVERLAIHGGSLRLFASAVGAGRTVAPTVGTMLRSEIEWGVWGGHVYAQFAAKVQSLREALRALLLDLKQDGKSLAAYGASAKGCTLLNYVGVGHDVLDFVADRSTVKQGRFTPGTRLPILAAERLAELKPDYTLLLTWNFADEILAQQAAYMQAGGRFILPVPVPRVVGV